MVLQGLELWAIVDPTAPTSVCPITQTPASVPIPTSSGILTTVAGSVPTLIPTPALDAALEWDRKNAKALSLLGISTQFDD